MAPQTLKRPLVHIVLLNYRGVAYTLACLESLRRLAYNNYRITVVDNASGDGSVEQLEALLANDPAAFHLIVSPDNRGYSAGNNLAIRYARQLPEPERPKYIWLLNNDTTVDPQALDALVNEAEKTGGLTGSLLLYPDGAYQQVGTRIRWWTGGARGIPESELADGMAVECLSGASLLVPMAVIERVGLLDESFFLYFEDGEYTLRATRQGFSATVALGSRVFHTESATTGRTSLNTQYYFQRNRLRLLVQYAGFPQRISIVAYACFRLLRSVVKWMFRPSPERCVGTWVQWLAWRDFVRGVSGRCPHRFQSHVQEVSS